VYAVSSSSDEDWEKGQHEDEEVHDEENRRLAFFGLHIHHSWRCHHQFFNFLIYFYFHFKLI